MKAKPKHTRLFFASIISIALGISVTNISEDLGSLGVVLIAVGGLFLIMAFSAKNKENDNQE